MSNYPSYELGIKAPQRQFSENRARVISVTLSAIVSAGMLVRPANSFLALFQVMSMHHRRRTATLTWSTSSRVGVWVLFSLEAFSTACDKEIGEGRIQPIISAYLCRH